MAERVADVCMCLGQETFLVGQAFFHGYGKSLRTSFSYATEWMSNPHAFALSPAMPLGRRSHQAAGLPAFLSDATPDGWGRHLIFRGAQDAARIARAPLRSLDDVDYLFGVDDWSRMGGIRISPDGGRTFLGQGTDVPKLVRLPELLAASRHVSAGADGWEEVKSLLDAGSSSLGGARPKATVDDGGTLMLAKFPSAHDEWDVIAWEAWALEMAHRAGLRVPDRRLERIGESSVLLERRFDRTADGRIPYQSALCALNLEDGAESDYVELGDVVRELSAQPQEDLEELFGRMVLSIALHNTDDHLRNHGFLRHAEGWRLSPAFDVNPNPYAMEGRALPIFGATGQDEVAAFASVGELFGMSVVRQRAVVRRVVDAFGWWESVARRMGCPVREVAMFRPVVQERLDALGELTR